MELGGEEAMPTPQRKRSRAEMEQSSSKHTRAPTNIAQVAVRTVEPLTAREAKPITDEIKAKLKGKKFYPGSHAESRSIHFSTPRFPLDRAEHFLGLGADGKPAARKFSGEQIRTLLRLKPDTLKATLYKKPHRFSKPGATATRWGTAPVKLLSMEVCYKAGSLRGHLNCINAPDPAEEEHAARMLALQASIAASRKEAGRAKASDLQERPVIGDLVRILDTPHVRKRLPVSCIGKQVTISIDDKSDCPYRVCSDRAEAPCSLHREDVALVAKAAAGKSRRILEFSSNKLKMLCSDTTTFVNFHRALQTCIQACKGVNASNFLFELSGKKVGSDGTEDARFLSELKVGDVVTYTSEFNSSYGKSKFMLLRVTGACAVQDSAGETPWDRPKFLDDGFLPRCIEATAEKTRDVANWRLCHMRFDLVKDMRSFERDDLMMTRMGPDDKSCYGSFSQRRRGPGKFRREAVMRRMSLDLAGELDIAQAGDDKLSGIKIER
jgi:hypothetical protein